MKSEKQIRDRIYSLRNQAKQKHELIFESELINRKIELLEWVLR